MGWRPPLVDTSPLVAAKAASSPSHYRRFCSTYCASVPENNRQLSTDDKDHVESGEALIYAEMSHLMLRHLTRGDTHSSPLVDCQNGSSGTGGPA